jgi:hypothetical protein
MLCVPTVDMHRKFSTPNLPLPWITFSQLYTAPNHQPRDPLQEVVGWLGGSHGILPRPCSWRPTRAEHALQMRRGDVDRL